MAELGQMENPNTDNSSSSGRFNLNVVLSYPDQHHCSIVSIQVNVRECYTFYKVNDKENKEYGAKCGIL